MAGPSRDLGRDPDVYLLHILNVGVGTQRASVGPATSGSGTVIISRLRARVGRWTGTNATFRIGVMSTNSNGQPNAVLGYTVEATTSVPFTGSNGGETRWFNLDTPIVVPENALLAFVATARIGVLSVGMEVTGASALYDRDIAAGTTIPLAGFSTIPANGRNAIQAQGELNQPPNVPGVPVRSGGANNQQPTMTVGFSDPNETLRFEQSYDRLEQFEREILWGGVSRSKVLYTATTAERNARQSNRQIAVSVPFNTTITFREWHYDRLGAKSPVRETTFVVQSGAVVDQPTSPAGFITNMANPGNVQAMYRNSAGLNANAARVQLRNAAGGLMAESSIIAVSIAPNGQLNIPWSSTGFGSLPQASERQITVTARDTAGNWSQPSAAVSLRMNTAPDIPIITAPAAGAVAASLPILRATGNDVDGNNGTKNVGMTLYVEILDNSDTVIETYTADWTDWVAGTAFLHPDVYEDDIPGYGTYKHRWYAGDGHLFSGGATSAATASRSPARTFVYAAVPSVSITAPSSPVNTTTPTITWDASEQTHWRIEGRDGSGSLVYDTGQQSGSDDFHQVAASANWLNGYRWRNGHEVTFVISVRNSAGLWGSSDPLPLMLEYDPIDQPTIDGDALAFAGVKGTHYTHLVSGESTYPGFAYRHWTRSDLIAPGGQPIAGTEITLLYTEDESVREVMDFETVSRRWYRYTLVQGVAIGVDIVESEPVSIDLQCEWWGMLIHSNVNPMASFVWLNFGEVGGRYRTTASRSHQRDTTWSRGETAPNTYLKRRRDDSYSGEYTFLPTAGQSAEDQLARLHQVEDWQYREESPNGLPNGICLREGRGGRHGIAFVTLTDIREHGDMGQTQVVSLTFGVYRRRRLLVTGDAG